MESQALFDEICFRLREKRKFRGMSQAYVSKFIGLSQSQFSKVERGIQPVLLQDIIKLCDLYNCSISSIIPSDKLDN